MGKNRKGKYTVTFLSERKEIEAEEGTTLLEAAAEAEVHLNNLCGGEGLCGECRVQIVKGKARANSSAIGFLSKEEVENGYVLACQTRIEDNLEVVVPSRAALAEEQILTEGATIAYSEPEKIALYRRPEDPAHLFEPLVTKAYLELPQPTMSDNISDIDRIIRELNKRKRYSSVEITLACLQNLAAKLRENDWKVTASIARNNGIGRILQIEGGDTTERNYGLAVDIGTTTVVVQLIHLKTGKVIGVEASHNRQAHYGEDVISRMIFACNRGAALDTLHKAIVTNVNNLTEAVAKEKGIALDDITCMVAASNTTMSHFLLRLMPCSIRLEPYVPTATVYPQVLARDVGIEINTRGVIEVMPSVASYIGGDTVAGIIACGIADSPEVKCLIDVGTNGEIAIGNNEWLVCCSASAGPAFEGGGIKWGMRATKGAIDKLELKDGKVTYQTIGKAKPAGICGSGLLDCIYEMVRNSIIGQDGKFNTSLHDKRLIIEDSEPQYILAFPEETETGQALTISQSDISNIIKSKGAVFAAIKSLVDYVGLKFDQLKTIFVAGGFGNSINVPKAIGIGLLPDVSPERIQFVGNSSVMGARMALVSGHASEAATSIARRMTNIELSNYVPFMNEFIAALFLPHTDGKLFPSVKYGHDRQA